MNIEINIERPEKKNILVLLSPWTSQKHIFHDVTRKIPEDFGYVYYHYTKDVITDDAKRTRDLIRAVRDKIIHDMKSLREIKERNFYVYAESLGTGFALMICDKVKIEKVVLVTAGYDMAECFWKGRFTQYYKKKMEENGMTLKKLKQMWKEFSAKKHLEKHAKNTKFLIKLAKNDHTLPFEQGLKLVKEMEKRNIEFELHIEDIHQKHSKNFSAHRLAVMYDCFFPEESLSFLTKKSGDTGI